jgi:glycosyltransferase involved in cell wall biosynthesis
MNLLQESPTVYRRRSKTFRVAFICTTVSGVAKYRMGNFAWMMRKWPNVETVLWPYSASTTLQNPWQVDMLSRPDIMQTIDDLCDKADVVVWQTLDFPHSWDLWQSMKLRHQKPFFLELDDYISDIPPDHEAYEHYKGKRHKIIMAQMAHSDGLIVSTPYLAEQYKGRNAKIYVVPNSIDFREWKGLELRRHNRLRIGWIGGGTHGKDLEMVAPVLEELLSKYWKKDLWFYCVHGCPELYKKWPRVYHTLKWANINLYPRFMNSFKFDIGIAPLEDNNFNRGKSNLRWLEYSALKIPCVASPLPDFVWAIQDGKTGFLASDLKDWKDSLTMLIELEGLRREVGRAAYEKVKSDFNVVKTSRSYLQVLREVAA